MGFKRESVGGQSQEGKVAHRSKRIQTYKIPRRPEYLNYSVRSNGEENKRIRQGTCGSSMCVFRKSLGRHAFIRVSLPLPRISPPENLVNQHLPKSHGFFLQDILGHLAPTSVIVRKGPSSAFYDFSHDLQRYSLLRYYQLPDILKVFLQLSVTQVLISHIPATVGCFRVKHY